MKKHSKIYCIIYKDGRLVFSRATVRSFGLHNFTHVSLSWDNHNKLICLNLLTEPNEDAWKIWRTATGRTTTYGVTLASFIREFDLAQWKGKRLYKLEIVDENLLRIGEE